MQWDNFEPYSSPRLQGKRVLVTGADTGIGLGTALEFARHGAAVALHSPVEAESTLAAVEAIRKAGGNAAAFQADFNDIEAVKRLGQEAVELLEGLDVLINNAGITVNLPFERVTVEQFDTLYRVNVRAPYFLTQEALPALLASSGAIINISSVHAFEGSPEHSAYAGTKGSIVAFTRELAIELAPRGVRVNAIAPGAIVVENYYKVVPDFNPQELGRLIPCGFPGEPRDIACAAVYLASPEARYLIGQTLIIDGGTTSWMPFSAAFREPSKNQFGKGYVPGL